jgi:hypothetical protein
MDYTMNGRIGIPACPLNERGLVRDAAYRITERGVDRIIEILL